MGSNRLAAGLVALTVVLALAAGAAADNAVSPDRSVQNVTAHNGLLAWSRVGSDGRSRLVHRVGQKGRDVPVRPKSGGLFDPDVGTTTRGNETIVYTRCAGLSGRDCDVWQYDGFDRTERKVPGASSARCSEFAPSVWLGTVAFARTGGSGCRGLYVTRRGVTRKLDDRVPADTDLRGDRVAYLYLPPANTSRSYIRVRRTHSGRSRLVVSGFRDAGESFRVSSPVLEGRYVYWLIADLTRNEQFAARALVARRSPIEFSDRLLPRTATSLAVVRERLYYTDPLGLLVADQPAPVFAPRD
jgi:hypothetical protein